MYTALPEGQEPIHAVFLPADASHGRPKSGCTMHAYQKKRLHLAPVWHMLHPDLTNRNLLLGLLSRAQPDGVSWVDTSIEASFSILSSPSYISRAVGTLYSFPRRHVMSDIDIESLPIQQS